VPARPSGEGRLATVRDYVYPELYIKTQSVPRSKHSVWVIKTSQLMLYREIIAVCSQIHTRHINTMCGQNVELYIKIQSVPRSKHTPSRLQKPVS